MQAFRYEKLSGAVGKDVLYVTLAATKSTHVAGFEAAAQISRSKWP